jgi:protein-disulfide isomerase
MRRWTIAVAALGVATACAAQIGELELRRFAKAYMAYMPGSTVTLKESTLHTAPAGPYQTVRAERTTIVAEGKEPLALLVDPVARTAVAGLLFPMPPTDPPVTGATLPRFVEEVLPQALSSYLGSRVRVPWPMSPFRPSGVLPLIAKVETGYGTMQMALAISTDGKYVALGGSWPLDRDPRAVRREILAAASVQWDPDHEKAPVKVVEFSDFQCPACKRGWGVIKPVLAENGENVRHGLVNYPLYNTHPWSFRAAVAGECVGSIWPDRLTPLKEEFYRLQDSMTLDSVDPAAFGFVAEQNLDEKSFRACYLKDSAIDTVLHQLELGYRLGVFGTPTYFANGEQQPWNDAEVFGKRLQAMIAANGRPEDAADVVVTPKPTAEETQAPKH